MKEETMNKLSKFNFSLNEKLQLSEGAKIFETYLNQIASGEGMIGDNNYLLLWKKDEIEELNNEYQTQEFLNDILLVGSDGGDLAYGIDIYGRYIEVPFIGMDDKEVKIIAEDFDGFVEYVWSKE